MASKKILSGTLVLAGTIVFLYNLVYNLGCVGDVCSTLQPFAPQGIAGIVLIVAGIALMFFGKQKLPAKESQPAVK